METTRATKPLTASGAMQYTFRGIPRQDGRVGTRNYLAVLIASNCAASAARFAAEWFDEDRMAEWPQVDGVLPLVHDVGCGMEMTGEPMDLLRRTLSGTIRHPNIAGAVVLALGCERNNVRAFFKQEGLQESRMLRAIVLQESGGTAGAVQAAREALLEMLPVANSQHRVEVPFSALTVGLQHYGTGAEKAIRDAAQALSETGARLILADSRGPGREAGPHPVYGVSPGAYRRYGELAGEERVTVMQAPENPVIATTGQLAAGASLVLAAFDHATDVGATAVPCIKLATAERSWSRVGMDMDMASCAKEQALRDVLPGMLEGYASGQPTLAEKAAAGDAEFIPWPVGVLV